MVFSARYVSNTHATCTVKQLLLVICQPVPNDLIISNDDDSVVSLIRMRLLWLRSQPHEPCLGDVANCSLLFGASQLTNLSKGFRRLRGGMVP